MLRLLAANAGGTVSREALSGPGGAGNERTIDVQVNRLAPEDRGRPGEPAVFADCAGGGVSAAGGPVGPPQ